MELIEPLQQEGANYRPTVWLTTLRHKQTETHIQGGMAGSQRVLLSTSQSHTYYGKGRASDCPGGVRAQVCTNISVDTKAQARPR